jgi:hypothetical protein
MPEGWMMAGLRLHKTPVGAEATIVTDSVNPLFGVTVTLVIPELLDAMEIESELTEISKSGKTTGVTATATVAGCDSDPLLPVIVMV